MRCPTTRPGRSPTAATSSGSSFRPARRAPSCSRRRRTAGVTLRQGERLLPGRAWRRARAAARLQLRLAGRDRRRRAQCSGALRERRRLRRSSCASRIPPEQADTEREQDQPDERDSSRREHEVDVHLRPVLEDESDRVCDEEPQDDQSRVEAGLPAVGDLVGIDAWAAQAHGPMLRGTTPRRRQRARAGRDEAAAGGVSRPTDWVRNVGQVSSPGRAQRPARRK